MMSAMRLLLPVGRHPTTGCSWPVAAVTRVTPKFRLQSEHPIADLRLRSAVVWSRHLPDFRAREADGCYRCGTDVKESLMEGIGVTQREPQQTAPRGYWRFHLALTAIIFAKWASGAALYKAAPQSRGCVKGAGELYDAANVICLQKCLL